MSGIMNDYNAMVLGSLNLDLLPNGCRVFSAQL